MNSQPLGELVRVPLREVWNGEASDFTPWLAQSDNLRRLGNALGLELECEAQEKAVGPFRADIVCRIAESDEAVLIENQLERTDHSHLGQLLTYAAGLDAVTLVWLAEKFTAEHRAALDWLNEHTDERIHCFGLEIELWRIGHSPVAPKFNVVCQPNEWTRAVVQSVRNPELHQTNLDYWTSFLAVLSKEAGWDRLPNPSRKGFINLPSQWPELRFSVYKYQSKMRVGFYVTFLGERALALFEKLHTSAAEIESSVGSALVWETDADNGKPYISSRIFDVDSHDRADWPRQHDLLAKGVTKLRNAIALAWA